MIIFLFLTFYISTYFIFFVIGAKQIYYYDYDCMMIFGGAARPFHTSYGVWRALLDLP